MQRDFTTNQFSVCLRVFRALIAREGHKILLPRPVEKYIEQMVTFLKKWYLGLADVQYPKVACVYVKRKILIFYGFILGFNFRESISWFFPSLVSRG